MIKFRLKDKLAKSLLLPTTVLGLSFSHYSNAIKPECINPVDFLASTGCKISELNNSVTAEKTAKLYTAAGLNIDPLDNAEALKAMEKLVILVDGLDDNTIPDTQIQRIHLAAQEIANQGKYSVLTYDYKDDLGALGTIQYNASVLAKFIADVKQMRGRDLPNVALVGYSLGGVLGRYSLKTMENDSVDHGVSLFVSYEAPHKGVYIPQGLQNILPVYSYYTGTILGGINSTLRDAGIMLHVNAFGQTIDQLAMSQDNLIKDAIGLTFKSPIGKQLLMDNVYGAADYTSFMTELDNLGFPTKTRNIAITNGSLYGVVQDAWQLESSGAVYRFQGRRGYEVGSANNLPIGQKFAQAEFAIYPTKKSSKSIHANISAYRKDKIWIVENLASGHAPKTINSLSNAKEYDIAPGGYLDLSHILRSANRVFQNMSDYVTIKHEPSFKFPFVPTYSSLAIESDNFNQAINESESPFDRIIGMGDGAVSDSNLAHYDVQFPSDIYDELDEATKPVIKLDEKVVLWLHLPTTNISDFRDVALCCLSNDRRSGTHALYYAEDIDNYRKSVGFSAINDLHLAKTEPYETYTTPELIQAFRDHVKSLGDSFLQGYTKEQCELDDKMGASRELTHPSICGKIEI